MKYLPPLSPGTQSSLEQPAPPTKEQMQSHIKDRVKNIMHDMLNEIVKTAHSKQGSSFDHGEAISSSHMSGVSTDDLANINNQITPTESGRPNKNGKG